MITQNKIPFQPQASNALHSVTPPPLQTWPLRLWQQQAAQLHRDPEARRLAIAHHLEIRRRHAVTVEQVLWFDSLGCDQVGEVTP
jgi:hypothetical protein